MKKLRHCKCRVLLCWTVVDNVTDNNIQQLFFMRQHQIELS